MYYLNCSLDTPAANLALDEALLLRSENGGRGEGLRIWESSVPFIVLGHGSKVSQEVSVASAERREVPVLRRTSGGGTVVQGPGCLSYALILSTERPETATISRTNSFIMDKNRAALQRLTAGRIEVSGFTDLSIASRKFSGNAQRRLKRHLLFHGTVLYRAQPELIEELLLPPPRQPAYRAARSHGAFLMDFPAAPAAIINVLREEWAAHDEAAAAPFDDVEDLMRQKYLLREWNFKF